MPQIAGITRDVSRLSPERQKQYIAFIRLDTPASVAMAMTMLGCARRDAEAVRECLVTLGQKPSTDQAETRIGKIDDTLAGLRDRRNELDKEIDLLLAERSQCQNNVGSLRGWRHAVSMSMTKAIVIETLRPELQAAGFLEK